MEFDHKCADHKRNMYSGLGDIEKTMKNRKKLVITIQILLIVIIGLFLFRPLESYQLDVNGANNISLHRGVYLVEIEYYAEVDYANAVTMTIGENEKACIRMNDFSLDSYTEKKSCPIWVLDNVSTLSIAPYGSGNGAFEVYGLTIKETHQLTMMLMAILSVIFVLFDVFWMLDEYFTARAQKKTYRKVVFVLGITILFSSLPVMADYIIRGADLMFHLTRIESLKEGLISGQIPTRIGSYWLRGKGYASSIYYADTFLLLPAVMRMMGFTIQTSYLKYIVFINALTVLIAFFSFYKIFAKHEYGIFAAVLYGMAPYRLYNIYARAAVGEYTAMAFLPLIILGFYMIYSVKQEEKNNKGWLYLTLGMSGIIQSHVLTCEMVAVLAVILCVVMIKRTLTAKVFLNLLKAVGATVCINLWFLVPFLDYMISEDVWVKHISENSFIQERGLYLSHYFLTALFSGTTSHYNLYGMVGGEATTIGPAFLLCILLFVFIKICGEKPQIERKYNALGNISFGLAMLAIFMTLNVFPWDALQRRSKILATLITSLQFPFRFLSLISAILVIVGCVLLYSMNVDKRKKIVAALLLSVQVLSSMFLLDNILYERNFFELYACENMGTISVANGEYIPTGAVLSDMCENTQVSSSETVRIKEYEKEYLDITMNIESAEAGYVDVPLLYYSDYKAYDVENGAELSVIPSDSMLVRVEIPEGFDGMVQIEYAVPTLWRIAEVVSLVSIVGCIMYLVMRKRHLWVK